MDSKQVNKPHALCIPFPAQGHINPMLKLAKILHSKGFLITFVNTEFNHQRLLKSRGSHALDGLPSFRFEAIPDGLPSPENLDATQDIPTLCKSTKETCLGPFKKVIEKINASYSPVNCIVADFSMGFTLDAAEELRIPELLFWTAGPGSLVCYDQYPKLIEKGLMPLKDPNHLTDGYLDTVVDFIPSMDDIRLKDIPPFVRGIHPGDEIMIDYVISEIKRAKKARGIIFNTFNDLENDVLKTLSLTFPPCYAIGPLPLIHKKINDETLSTIGSNLWKEETKCLQWLDSKTPSSVVYVNFGSITVMTPQQLVEFCWGLAKSNHTFLWIIRPDLVIGDHAMLPHEFLVETGDRGLLASWCDQEQVLSHPSIGGFLTHGGWNSTIESIIAGVPMICWPFFADQQTNCWSCTKWGFSMEIDNDVKRNEVGRMVMELMGGKKGKEMKKNVVEWQNKAKEACKIPSGSSMINLDKMIRYLNSGLN